MNQPLPLLLKNCIPELPPYISTTRAKNPYPAIDRPVNFSCCTRGMVVMYMEKVPNRNSPAAVLFRESLSALNVF